MSKLNSWVVLVMVMTLLVVAAPALADGGCCDEPCYVRSPGYWMTHSEEWPVDSIDVGGVTYSKDAAIALMQGNGGDKTITLFRAVVAAKLNVMYGCDCWGVFAGSHIPFADGLLAQAPPGTGMRANSAWWQYGGECTYNLLDSFNNGLYCPCAVAAD